MSYEWKAPRPYEEPYREPLGYRIRTRLRGLDDLFLKVWPAVSVILYFGILIWGVYQVRQFFIEMQPHLKAWGLEKAVEYAVGVCQAFLTLWVLRSTMRAK